MAKGSNNLSGRRSSSHNTKPYDANNSFVKKVATKVTDLIPQRLWISKWFHSSQNDEDVLENNENPEEEEEVESEEDIQKPPPLKRPCIRMDVTHPPGTFTIQPRAKSTVNKTNPSKQQYSIHDETSDDFCKPAMAGPSGMSHLVSSTSGTQSDIRDITSQRSELNTLVATANNGTTNGMDDNSESSESTSGCSSLIPQTNRQEAPSNVSYSSQFSNRKKFNDDKLSFTNHMQSPRSLFLSNNTRDSLSSRRPSFNASIITNTPDRASPLASPFYSGNITFGGANAAGLKRGRNLFNSSNEIQLKVPKRTRVEVKPSNTAGVDSSGMSQTAKKILEALEHFSSPITDAKKIPLKMMNNTSSVSKKRTREEMTSTTKVGLRHLTRELTVPTIPDILKLRRRQKLQDTTAAARKIVSARSEPPPQQEYHLRTQAAEDSKHHGKVKTKTTNLEQENTVEPINLPNIPLPISSLPNFNFMPSTGSKVADKADIDKGDTFTFASPIKVTNTTTKNLKSINNFTFSTPINADKQSTDKSNDSNSPSKKRKVQLDSNTESTNDKINKVILDTNKDDDITEVVNSKSNTQNISIMWECSECLFKNNDSETRCFACKASKPNIKDKNTSEVSISSNTNELKATVKDHFGSEFKLSNNQWECTSCFVRNKQNDTNCVACSALKPDTKQESKFVKHEMPEKCWECPKCKVDVSENSITCFSCNTPKSSTLKISPQKNINPTDNTNISINQNIRTPFNIINPDKTMDKFKPSKDTWECPCCMVRSSVYVDSCPCCNTAKPSIGVTTKSVPSVSNGFGDKFKKPEGEWNCDTCMLQNEAKNTKCVACGDSKPGSKKLDNTTPANTNSNLQFNFDMPANASGFKFGIDKSGQEKTDSTISTNGFKFGENQQNNQIGQFTFGNGFGFQSNTSNGEKTDTKQDLEKVEKNSTSLFSFGIAKSESRATESDKQPANVTTTISSTFTFGAPKATDVQSDIKEEKQTLLGNTTVEVPQSSIVTTESSVAINTNTLSSITQSNTSITQETKPTATFSFGVPSNTIAVTSNTSTTVVSSLPSSTQSSFTFLESKSTAPTSLVPSFIPTSAPASNLSNTFTFGDSKTKEESSVTKTFGTLPNTSSGNSLFSSIPNTPSLFNNNDIKTTPTFGQTAPEDNKQPVFNATDTNKSSTFAMPENKVPLFGNTENKRTIFGSTDTKIPVFGSTDNKTSLFNPTLQAPSATPTPFGSPSTTQPLFGANVTPVFGNNTASTFTTESTPRMNETNTPNPNIFTFAPAFAQPTAANPIFGAPQPGTQNQASSSFSSTPSNSGFNFGSTAPATSSGGFNFGTVAPASAPSAGFNFNPPGTTPTFDPNTPPSFNFTGGNAPTAFTGNPTQIPRKIKKALRRMR
ncbi:E3 SUMO-protein ligase RanBP2 [Eufriesea mexicana]|uniref:Nuclear pore complex protein Nup153 n=1 Tax=Eufriesea mexicana TaxID=516756 RepID=A0A310SNH2_9HYME|nr:E3 SUMO-protein ligase RanBP2 [Eufriesea mexicana]